MTLIGSVLFVAYMGTLYAAYRFALISHKSKVDSPVFKKSTAAWLFFAVVNGAVAGFGMFVSGQPADISFYVAIGNTGLIGICGVMADVALKISSEN